MTRTILQFSEYAENHWIAIGPLGLQTNQSTGATSVAYPEVQYYIERTEETEAPFAVFVYNASGVYLKRDYLSFETYAQARDFLQLVADHGLVKKDIEEGWRLRGIELNK